MSRTRAPLPRRMAPWHWNWRWRITDNEWRKNMWERSAPVIVALFGLIIVVSLPTIAVQQFDANRSQNNHHTATTKQQNEIIALEMANNALLVTVKNAQTDHAGTLSEIKTLALAVNNVIAGLPAADTYLASLAKGLEGQIESLCSATHAACPSLNPNS